ncbi:MAG: hypothetical protein JWQ24_2484 [Tardiphaga sp.]|nr:hypothetical protein [Tardiphaga sp.]
MGRRDGSLNDRSVDGQVRVDHEVKMAAGNRNDVEAQEWRRQWRRCPERPVVSHSNLQP